MEWKDVASIVAKNAPVLGGLLAGPPGAAVGAVGAMIASAFGVGATPEEVGQVLTNNPDAAVKLREIESTRQVQLQTLTVQAAANQLAAEASNMSAINQTMQAEAQSSHWPTYTWRPFIGFAVGFNVVASSVLVLAVFVPVMWGNKEAAAAAAQLPAVLGALAAINATVLPILGIASWFRGKAQSDPMNPMPVKG
jgi:hypothetical protein